MIDRQVRQHTGSGWRREELGMSDKSGGGKSRAGAGAVRGRARSAGAGQAERGGGKSSAGVGAERGGGTSRAGGREKQTGDGLSRALGATAAFAAGYGTRKLVTLAWKQITGKEPPSDPNDPHVGIGEALSWALVLGASMETARLLAGRAATRKMRRNDGGAG